MGRRVARHVGGRIDQPLQAGRMRLVAHCLSDHRGECPAGRIARYDDAIGVEAERDGLARHPAIGGECIVHRGREFVLRRQPVIDRHDGAPRARAEIAAGEIVAFQAADDPAAAMVIHDCRQQARHGARRPVNADAGRAGGTGQGAIEDGAHRRGVAAQQLHEGVVVLARLDHTHRVRGGLAAEGEQLQEPLGATIEGAAVDPDRRASQYVHPGNRHAQCQVGDLALDLPRDLLHRHGVYLAPPRPVVEPAGTG